MRAVDFGSGTVMPRALPSGLHELEGEQLVEHAAIDLVALLRRHRLARALLDVADGALELTLAGARR